MLPQAYELPAAIVLVLGGALSCFAGYRLFKVVLALYGFILGAMLATSMLNVASTLGTIAAAAIGGIAGALILVFAYFVGIALVGAGLGALIAHAGWTSMRAGDPPALLVIGLAVAGAIGAMILQRYVIIVSTAFGGAWTLILGAMAIGGDTAATKASRTATTWIPYPTGESMGGWVLIAWVALGLLGTGVQLGITGRKK
jgi:Domain of unknown function (DUF4203)